MSRKALAALAALVVFTLVFGAFVSGAAIERFIGFDTLTSDIPEPDEDLSRVIDEVADLLRRGALEPSSDESMTAGAIQGVLDSLDDPYAIYFDRQGYSYFSEQNDGTFYGIGVTITERDGGVFIVSPIDGTPAAEAGLLAEDEIVSVDDYAPDTWSLDEVVARVRGEEGTDVTLGIAREGEEELLEFTITRARIDVPNVESEMIEDDIGYVRLFTFNSLAADDLRNAVEGLEDEGARGFVLDLRDNPGGLLSASVEVSSLFVSDGVIVTVEERDREPEIHHARGRLATELPIVVLINENSASASEIVAGALQDYERGTLVGQTTFGKGSVQSVDELSNGGAVKYTIARYLTPKGRSIHKIGVVPEIVVEMSPRDQMDRETDVQLDRAIQVLRDDLE